MSAFFEMERRMLNALRRFEKIEHNDLLWLKKRRFISLKPKSKSCDDSLLTESGKAELYGLKKLAMGDFIENFAKIAGTIALVFIWVGNTTTELKITTTIFVVLFGLLAYSVSLAFSDFGLQKLIANGKER